MRELLLFTTNHPFTFTGGETMFVAPELPALAAAFDRVTVVPLHAQGTQLPLPAGVVLDTSMAQAWRRRRIACLLGALAWPGFWPEFIRGWRRGGWVGAARVWRWAGVARVAWAWLQSPTRAVPAGPTLLYSYWRGGQTLAALRWAQGHAGGRVVTRVHGYDLYAEAFRPPFQPWTALYARVDRVLAISRHGADYLLGHGVAPGRVTLARLGVSGADVRACASDDGVWRVVSCSNVIALKRVDRIARALVLLARRRPAQRLAWTHFGAGPEMPAVQAALQGAPVNLEVALAGQVPNETVRAHYAGHPVDLFVLLSRTEGLPVSIQEALAAGIPVLATDVGGVAEAVDRNGDNGALVAADAPDDVVADALERLLAEPDPTRAAARRDAAWQRWAEAFDARRNHQRLAEQLQALLAPAR